MQVLLVRLVERIAAPVFLNRERLRQPVIQPLRALKLAVVPGNFALPRAAALNPGVLAAASGNFVGTAVAVRREIAREVGKDSVPVRVSESTGTFVFPDTVEHEERIKTVRRTQVQRAGTLVVEGGSYRAAMTQHVLLRWGNCLAGQLPARMKVDAPGFRKLLRTSRSAEHC